MPRLSDQSTSSFLTSTNTKESFHSATNDELMCFGNLWPDTSPYPCEISRRAEKVQESGRDHYLTTYHATLIKDEDTITEKDLAYQHELGRLHEEIRRLSRLIHFKEQAIYKIDNYESLESNEGSTTKKEEERSSLSERLHGYTVLKAELENCEAVVQTWLRILRSD